MIWVKNEPLHIFKGVLSLCYSDSHEDIQSYYKSEAFDDIEDANGLASIITFRKKVTYVLAVVEGVDKTTIGVISHEAVHLAQFICDHIGHEAYPTQDEIYSHLAHYITDRYIKFLKKIGKWEEFQ